MTIYFCFLNKPEFYDLLKFKKKKQKLILPYLEKS